MMMKMMIITIFILQITVVVVVVEKSKVIHGVAYQRFVLGFFFFHF